MCANVLLAAVERAKVFKLSFEYFHFHGTKRPTFAEKNNRIASLMSGQRSDMWKISKILLSTAKTRLANILVLKHLL